jgi:ORF6N domain.
MLDFDLAEMYQVETKNLNLSVKRNIKRFPSDFMFQLTKEEWEHLRFQFATSKRGGRRYQPYAFTEQGVAMLSGLLNSDVAIEVNISIMRAFVVIRGLMSSTTPQSIEERVRMLEDANEELLKEINDLSEDNRKEFDDIYIALSELADRNKRSGNPRKPIGFVKPNEE